MNKKILLQVTALLVPVWSPVGLFGQQSIGGLGLLYSENFNTFAGTENSIPANFSVVGEGVGNLQEPFFNGYYDSSDPYLSGNHIYALDDGTVGSGVAFGMKLMSGQGNPVFLEWSFINGAGADISGFVVDWGFEQFSASGRRTRITAEYNSAGAGWTSSGVIGANEQAAITGSGNHSPRLSTSNSFEVSLMTPLQHGESVVFRWGFYDGSGWTQNAHVGINNLSVQAIPEPSTYSLIMMGAALGLVWRVRRRNS